MTTTAERLALAQRFVDALPHAAALGLHLVWLGEGVVEMRLPWDARLVGDAAAGIIHGGAVSALMDTCASAAVLSHPGAPLTTATLDLRIDYMRPAASGSALIARADCHHMTRSVAFVRVEAREEGADPARPVAMAVAAFVVERRGTS